MAYYKMNTLQVHLNDNAFKQYFEHDWNKTYGAFRLESEFFPGLTARDGYYTKKEFIDFQLMADSLGVEIIPEIDVPAHSLALTHFRSEIGSAEYGMDHLDLSNRKLTSLSTVFSVNIWKADNLSLSENVYISGQTNIRIRSRM